MFLHVERAKTYAYLGLFVYKVTGFSLRIVFMLVQANLYMVIFILYLFFLSSQPLNYPGQIGYRQKERTGL